MRSFEQAANGDERIDRTERPSSQPAISAIRANANRARGRDALPDADRWP